MGKTKKNNKTNKTSLSYVNVNRTKSGYKDKYKKDVDKAVIEFANKIGKPNGDRLTKTEWKKFFKTVLIPLDKESERHMIDLFKGNRDELNDLLVLHNTLAGNNLAEVYYKKYEKESPTKWHDLEDFKQMALEGLTIAAKRFDLNSGNKFITYATWWVLNRVLKPAQEKGAMTAHTSLSSPARPGDSDNNATLEDIFTPSMLSADWNYSDEAVNPVAMLEKQNSDENYDLYSAIRHTTAKTIESLDHDKALRMTKYLMSIVERNRESYGNRQIFLYMFRKIFNKCSTLFKGDGEIESKQLTSYITEAAKSKSELLSRLNMDDRQYRVVCQSLLRKGYDGL